MIIFDVYTKISNIILFTHRFFFIEKIYYAKNVEKLPSKKLREHLQNSPLPPCEQTWTFPRLPPPPHPVHVVCEWPLTRQVTRMQMYSQKFWNSLPLKWNMPPFLLFFLISCKFWWLLHIESSTFKNHKKIAQK